MRYILLLLLAAPVAAQESDVLNGMTAGERAAEEVGNLALEIVGGAAVYGWIGWDNVSRGTITTEGDALGWAAGLGALGIAVGYAFAGVRSKPSDDLMASVADSSAVFREAFRRGYATRLKERRRTQAFVNGLVGAGAFLAGAYLQGDLRESGGWDLTLLQIRLP